MKTTTKIILGSKTYTLKALVKLWIDEIGPSPATHISGYKALHSLIQRLGADATKAQRLHAVESLLAFAES